MQKIVKVKDSGSTKVTTTITLSKTGSESKTFRVTFTKADPEAKAQVENLIVKECPEEGNFLPNT